ncbi:MAG: CBS domain-containing protein [Candidatus Omnitrophota bacterium]
MGKNHVEDLEKKLQAIKAKNIMTKEVITTVETASLSEIAEIMIKKRISGMPVVDIKGKIVGIVSEADLFLVMDMIKSGDVVEDSMAAISHPTVKFAMSTEVCKIKKDTTLDEIITLMKYKNIHTLPVFDGAKMVGVIGRRDVFKNFYSVIKKLV